jgi:hypothetical protein
MVESCLWPERRSAKARSAKVIDRLSSDLRQSFPEMKGLSPRNLKYMRAFAEAWPDRSIVQRAIARLPQSPKRKNGGKAGG